jgi:ATP synthase protein I
MRLAEMQDRTRRDVDRLRRRERNGRFWRSLGLIGSAGWPIVLLAVGGAVLGRYLDSLLGTGVRLSVGFLVLGTALGSFAAFRTLRGDAS